MKQTIRGTLGGRGSVRAMLVTDMDTGRSEIVVDVRAVATIETNQLEHMNSKWEQIADLRNEFSDRLRKILGMSP